MSPPLKMFLQRWLIYTAAVMVAANIVPGIEYAGWESLLMASLVLGVLNAILRPLLLLLSLPLIVYSLGLFALVINALMLYFVGQLVRSFQVAGFWAAFWGALLISLTTLLLGILIRPTEPRSEGDPPKPSRGDDRPPGQGPIIDV